MGTFVVYIIKSAVCLIVFYLFYKLLLSKDTFHRFNRIALLSLLLVSFVVPFGAISLSSSSEMGEQLAVMEDYVIQAAPMDLAPTFVVSTPAESSKLWVLLLVLLYLAGIVFLVSRQLWCMFRMFGLMRNSREEKRMENATLLVHSKEIAPFSWMKYIIISEKDLEENGKEILTHELAHIQKKHTWDLIVADICIFSQWFNPAAWLLKQELQSIHEFEADDMVLKQGIDAKQYQLLIIKKAVGKRLYSMANSFNHSSLKKRITMMLKEKSSPWARLKYIYVLPLACITILAFARPEVSSAEKESVEKVNDFLALTQEVKNSLETKSASKIKEISGKNKSEVVKKSENNEQVISSYVVKGKVISSLNKKPLSSVSVVVMDASGKSVNSHSTITKEDGTFEIDAKTTKNKLVFSHVGFKTTKSSVNETMTIQMDEANLLVNETVVIGYAPSKEKQVSKNPSQDNNNEGVLVEQMPEYPGGSKALMEYISNSLRYPTSAIAKGVGGRVLCSCIVNEEGKVTDVKVVESVNPDLDKEAIRVIENMPDWIPGKQNGKGTPVKFTFPIVFKAM